MKIHLLTAAVLVAAAAMLSGCKVQTFDAGEFVFDRYYQTTLKYSTSSEVLPQIYDPTEEYLSQSEGVLVSWGVKDEEQTHWFNMVAFDEDTLTAARKYGFSLVERALYFNAPPKPMLRFDAEFVMDRELLEAAYPSKNARSLAVFAEAFKMFRADALEVSADATELNSSFMMVNQTLNAVAEKLNQSPASAIRLSHLEGVEFLHPTLGESRIRMIILDDVVKIKIKASPRWFLFKPFEEQEDVIYM